MDEDAPAAAGHSARLATDRASAQRLVDFLTEQAEDDQTAVAAFETADGGWTMAMYFSSPPNQAAVRALVGLGAGAEAADALVFEQIESRDWVAASLEGLAPVEAGRFFVHGSHDRAKLRHNRVGIEIEAALAFGTGHHGTTRGCLLALDHILQEKSFQLWQRPMRMSEQRGRNERRTSRRIRILDVGTGTGVLAIAAAKALRQDVLGSDIDRRSVQVARENARANAAAPWTRILHAAGLDAKEFRRYGPYDLVMANILLGPLMRLARSVRALLAPGARVVLSGLLHHQAPAALAAYRAQGLVLERRILLEGWTTLLLRRP